MQEITRALPLATHRTRLLLFVLFTAITLGPLTMVHAQWLTGPLVNTMLLLTCALVGPVEAMFLGLFPSTAALASGLLPLPLAPMVPFIMIGNALYVATFHYLRTRNAVAGIAAGSVLKYLFLAATARMLLTTLLDGPFAARAAVMMDWPQLATALLGGAIALVILFFLPRSVRPDRRP